MGDDFELDVLEKKGGLEQADEKESKKSKPAGAKVMRRGTDLRGGRWDLEALGTQKWEALA